MLNGNYKEFGVWEQLIRYGRSQHYHHLRKDAIAGGVVGGWGFGPLNFGGHVSLSSSSFKSSSLRYRARERGDIRLQRGDIKLQNRDDIH